MKRKAGRAAFGVEPSNRRFRLRLSRYPFQSQTLGQHLPESGSVVLDAGCGRGRLPRYFAMWGAPTKAPRFIGVDARADRVASSKPLYDEILQLDLTEGLPFDDAYFDAIVCEQVLEHLSENEVHKVLVEFRRVAKPGGLLLVGTPIFPSAALPLIPLFLRARARLSSRDDHGHLHHLDLPQLRRIVERGGFVVESTRGFRIFTLPWNWLEDFHWYYRLHEWLALRFPSLCLEVTLVARPNPNAPEKTT